MDAHAPHAAVYKPSKLLSLFSKARAALVQQWGVEGSRGEGDVTAVHLRDAMASAGRADVGGEAYPEDLHGIYAEYCAILARANAVDVAVCVIVSLCVFHHSSINQFIHAYNVHGTYVHAFIHMYVQIYMKIYRHTMHSHTNICMAYV